MSHPNLFRPNQKHPLLFVSISLIFLYVFQYPLNQLFDTSDVIVHYSLGDWLVGYIFVIFSTLILLLALVIGMSGKPATIYSQAMVWQSNMALGSLKRIGLIQVFLIFALFFVWSYVMQELKIGMTFYTDFDSLPFKLVGLLFYGRLFIQPLILVYIANNYAQSKWKYLILILLFALGVWASTTSGSRFVGIVFALPLLLLFNGNSRFIYFAVAAAVNIVIASLTRHFYLPFIIGGEYIQIYASEAYQAEVTENILLIPISYLVTRTMGMEEVLITLNFGNITPSFLDALQNLFSYFLPFIQQGDSVSIKNIYGFSNDEFGGFGLGMYPNYWVAFGGSLITYAVGLFCVGWLLGRSYRLFAIGLKRVGFEEGAMIIFVMLFILVFESRANLFPGLLLAAFIFSRKITVSWFNLMQRKLFIKRLRTVSHADVMQGVNLRQPE